MEYIVCEHVHEPTLLVPHRPAALGSEGVEDAGLTDAPPVTTCRQDGGQVRTCPGPGQRAVAPTSPASAIRAATPGASTGLGSRLT